MRTLILPVDALSPATEALQTAAAIIQAGGLVAFPTETVYGLGADALNEGAVERIFTAKGRPADNPLIVHIAAVEDVAAVAEPDPATLQRVQQLAHRFWPGPLTIVLPKRDSVPDGVTAGLDTVAVRMPNHPVALGLIRATGCPLAAPSANRSGRPSPTDAQHVREDLAGRIDLILNGGPTVIGLESTVLDLSVEPPLVHRPGAVTVEQLIDTLLTPVRMAAAEQQASPRSPGMKYEHYAPRTPCVLVEGSPRAVETELLRRLADERRGGRRTGVLATTEGEEIYRGAADAVCVSGSRDDHEAFAHNIYRCLRRLDQVDADIIYIEGIASEGLGVAIMNRLRRAAGHRIMYAP